MAIYSDLLFAVSGDPIDVRASIYKKYCNNYLKEKKNPLVINTSHQEKKFSGYFNF